PIAPRSVSRSSCERQAPASSSAVGAMPFPSPTCDARSSANPPRTSATGAIGQSADAVPAPTTSSHAIRMPCSSAIDMPRAMFEGSARADDRGNDIDVRSPRLFHRVVEERRRHLAELGVDRVIAGLLLLELGELRLRLRRARAERDRKPDPHRLADALEQVLRMPLVLRARARAALRNGDRLHRLRQLVEAGVIGAVEDALGGELERVGAELVDVPEERRELLLVVLAGVG